MDGWREVLEGLEANLVLEKELGSQRLELSPEMTAFVAAPVATGGTKKVVAISPALPPQEPIQAKEILFISEFAMPAEGEATGVFLKMVEAMKLAPSEWELCPLFLQESGSAKDKEAAVEGMLARIKQARPKAAVIFGSNTARSLLKNPAAILAPGQWVAIGDVPAVLSRAPELLVRLEKAKDMANLRAIKLEIWNKALVPALEKAGRRVAR